MITQSDCQQFLDLGGNPQTYLGAPSNVTTAALIFGWVQSIQDATARQRAIDLVKAYILANGGIGN